MEQKLIVSDSDHSTKVAPTTLKLRILLEKFLPIPLKLNLTPNTFGLYGLKKTRKR